MKHILFLFVLIGLGDTLSAQYVYTIKADSVKLTNCDSTELIIENHTQNVPGFLFNTGHGRTAFKKAVLKVNDSIYLIGADTLKLQPPQNFWSIAGNSGTAPATNFIGTRDSVTLIIKVNNQQAGKISPDGNNTFWGYLAGNTSTNSSNTGIGFKALSVNTGFGNTAVGWTALAANIGLQNTAVGTAALATNTSGSANTAVGNLSLNKNTSGLQNTAVGDFALASNTTANGNTAMGYWTLRTNSTGAANTALGNVCLTANTTGSKNTAIGNGSLNANTTGSGNSAVGTFSLAKNQSGGFNTAIGDSSLSQALTDSNVAIGYKAGLTTTVGSGNSYLGTYTGIGITTGGYNTILGSNVTGLSPVLNNNIILADGKGNRRINVDSLGNVMFNTISPIANNTFTGTGNFSDTLTATTMGNADSSNRVASTAWVQRQKYNSWMQGGNSFGTTGILGTLDNNHLDFYTNNIQRARLTNTGHLLLGATTDNGSKLQIAGSESISGGIYFPSNDTAGNGMIYINGNRFVSFYNGTPSYGYDNNIFLGKFSGNITNTSVGFNCGVGYDAMHFLTNGSDNVAVGYQALYGVTSGGYNIGIGSLALNGVGSGNYNVAIGQGAGSSSNNNGSYNVFLGTAAGATNKGSYNVFLGNLAGTSDTGSNHLYIANSNTSTPLIYGNFSTSLLTINGGVFVTGKTFLGGSTSPTAVLHLKAGTVTAGMAPLKLTSGAILTTPEDGAIEYDGTDLYLTNSVTRYKLVKAFAGQLTTDFGVSSLAAFTAVTTTLTVSGAQPGDVVSVNANSGASNPASVIITAYITAANTVTIRAYNAGNSTATITSDTYKVRIIQ